MTILGDSSVVLATAVIDLCNLDTHRIATIAGRSDFSIQSITMECMDAPQGCYPQFEIRSSDGLYLVHSWQCHFYNQGDTMSFPANGLRVAPGNEIELHVTQAAYHQCRVKVTVVGEFNEMDNKNVYGLSSGSIYGYSQSFASGVSENTMQMEQAVGYLQQLVAQQKELSQAVKTYIQHKTETPAEPGIMEASENANQNPCSEVTMSEVKQEKNLDNSLWSELPEEIREAAEKAGIGLEDLHEMVKDYTTLKEGAAQQERLLSFCAKDNYETRRPIVLAKIEAEKELKLAKIQSDAEVAKAQAASEAQATVAVADQRSRRAVQIGSTFRYLFVGASMTATLSYIAYCVSGIFL